MDADHLAALVSLFPNCFEQVPTKSVSVRAVLASIAEPPDKRRGLVLGMREAMLAGNEAEAERGKLKLPTATFSGTFGTKAKAATPEQTNWKPSGLACLDIDHLDTTGQAEELRDKLMDDQHTLAAFVSPRGLGVKVLVGLVASTPDEYSRAYAVAVDYFEKLTGLALDHTSDAKRNCFLSFDPGVKVREGEIESFTAPAMQAETRQVERGEATSPLDVGDVLGRARAYLEAMPRSGASGTAEGRCRPMYNAAFALVVKFGLTPDAALPLLQDFNKRSHTPWTDAELTDKLESAARSRAAGNAGSALAAKPKAATPEDWFSDLRRQYATALAEGRTGDAIVLAEVISRKYETKTTFTEAAAEWAVTAVQLRGRIRAATGRP